MPTQHAPPAYIAQHPPGHGGMAVLPNRHEVMWRDGSSVHLHPVHRYAAPLHTMRAVAAPAGALLLVDLVRLLPNLQATLREVAASELQTLVWHSLRLTYGSGPAFMATAERLNTGAWRPDGAGGYAWHPAARAVQADWLIAGTAQAGAA